LASSYPPSLQAAADEVIEWQPCLLLAQMRSADRDRKWQPLGADRTQGGFRQTDASDPEPRETFSTPLPLLQLL